MEGLADFTFMVCVNALNGLLLISSGVRTYCTVGDAMCQCPQRASTYFFLMLSRGADLILRVNALNGLLLISSALQKIFMGGDHVCQCPQRASTYFFSTLPEPLILLSSGEVFCK